LAKSGFGEKASAKVEETKEKKSGFGEAKKSNFTSGPLPPEMSQNI